MWSQAIDSSGSGLGTTSFSAPWGERRSPAFYASAPKRRGACRIEEHLHPRLSTDADLKEKFRAYLEDKDYVDYVPFEEGWDLRPLHITCSAVFERLGSSCPAQVATIVCLQPSGGVNVRTKMEEFLSERRSDVVHRTRRRPRWKKGVLKGEASPVQRRSGKRSTT